MSRGSNYAGANSRLLTSHSGHQSTEQGSRRETLLGSFVGLTILVFMLTASQLPAFSTDEMITVLPGQDLQIAIDEAPEGSTIILQAGESYKGVCIRKNITIRTDAPHEALGDIIQIALHGDDYGFDTAIAVQSGAARIDGPIRIYEGVVDLIGLYIRVADSTGVTVENGSLSMKRCLIDVCVNGVHLMHSSKATISDSAILFSDILGILVEADAYVEIDNTCIGWNGIDGIRLLGEVVIHGSFISKNGFVRPYSAKELAVTETGDGIEVLRGARLELRESWVVRNGGSGIHFYDLDYEDEQTPHVAGTGNVIPDLYEADANLQGAVRPNLYELSEEQEALCWPATFLAMTHALPTKFEWKYYGEDYVLETVLEVPVGGFTCEWDGTREGGEPRTAPDAFTHFTNATSLAPIVDQLMEFAETDGYQDLALADFILQFALQNTSYDAERREESRPSGYLIPTVTLAKREGVCRDTAVLVGVLLELAGFDSILVLLPPLDPEEEWHMAVGVDVEGAWGQFVEHDGKRFYLVDTTHIGLVYTTHIRNHIGGYSIKDWAEPTLIDVQFAPELVAEMSFFDLSAISESGNLGELRVRNRGSSPSSDASVHLYVGFSLAPDSADALSWDIGGLQPGEEHVLIVPNDGIISSQMIETCSVYDPLLLQVIIKMGESTDRFPFLFFPGYSNPPKCP